MMNKYLKNAKYPYCQITKTDLESLSESVHTNMEAIMKQNVVDKILKVHPYALPEKEKYLEGRQKTRVKDSNSSDGRRTIWANSEDEMYQKLYLHYFDNIFTVDAIWDLAIEETKKKSTKSLETFRELENSYKRFISEDFKNMTIDSISEDYIAEYSRNLVLDGNGMPRTPQLKESAFLAYKGILNIIFNYARKKKYISDNPLEFFSNVEYIKYCEPKRKKAEDKVFQPSEIELILKEINRRYAMKRYDGYYIFGYMIRMSIATGMRSAELCALHWEDVKESTIWIHRQLLERTSPLSFYEVNWTKNEKKHEGEGRYICRSEEINLILSELRKLQESKGIKSEYIFCNKEGNWITTRHYESALATVCNSLNLSKTNNHAIRMYLNSYVLIPGGMPETDRAKFLGQTVETNLKNYSFESIDYTDKARKILNSMHSNHNGPKLDPKNLVYFPVRNNEKALKLNV